MVHLPSRPASALWPEPTIIIRRLPLEFVIGRLPLELEDADGKVRGRFVAVTGRAVGGAPATAFSTVASKASWFVDPVSALGARSA